MSELNLPPELKELQQSREGVYGCWEDNMFTTSQIINALQTQWHANNPGYNNLPPWWHPLECVAVKLNRIACGRFRQDSFDDIKVYLSFVEAMMKEKQNGPS